ncbi:GL25541 [Drosophila persimilis]|uniref:GL25541 n=1 Tax=Drosophila persimilis TaxID=7234 RepID=B4GJ95_DROPE|nr:GL25541 [Drosophila persimilis]
MSCLLPPAAAASCCCCLLLLLLLFILVLARVLNFASNMETRELNTTHTTTTQKRRMRTGLVMDVLWDSGTEAD